MNHSLSDKDPCGWPKRPPPPPPTLPHFSSFYIGNPKNCNYKKIQKNLLKKLLCPCQHKTWQKIQKKVKKEKRKEKEKQKEEKNLLLNSSKEKPGRKRLRTPLVLGRVGGGGGGGEKAVINMGQP